VVKLIGIKTPRYLPDDPTGDCAGQEPFPMVKRPGLGQKGKTISITTNLFRVGCSKLTSKSMVYRGLRLDRGSLVVTPEGWLYQAVESRFNLYLVYVWLSAGKVFQYDVRFTTEDKPREDLFALKKHRELRVQIYKAFIEGSWQVGLC
jgi:hypothetical protein